VDLSLSPLLASPIPSFFVAHDSMNTTEGPFRTRLDISDEFFFMSGRGVEQRRCAHEDSPVDGNVMSFGAYRCQDFSTALSPRTTGILSESCHGLIAPIRRPVRRVRRPHRGLRVPVLFPCDIGNPPCHRRVSLGSLFSALSLATSSTESLGRRPELLALGTPIPIRCSRLCHAYPVICGNFTTA